MQAKNSQKSLFTARLTTLMFDKGVNQVSLSNLSGVNQSSISKYIRGESFPRAGELARMAMVLGVSMDYLWGNNNDDTPVKNDWKERAEKAESSLTELRTALKILVANVAALDE